MSEQSAAPQPQLGTIVKIQQREIDQLHSNKVYLLSLLDEYQQEIVRLREMFPVQQAEHEAALASLRLELEGASNEQDPVNQS